jgi:hypothetical protein
MNNAFQYPLTSRARDIFYKSPPARFVPPADETFETGILECESRAGTAGPVGDGTTAEAITALFGADDNGWSIAWLTPALGGCCVALQQALPEDGEFFEVRQVRFRITITGKNPGVAYNVPIGVMRRIQGSFDAYELVDTLTFHEIADVDGTISFISIFPDAEGFEGYPTLNSSGAGICASGGGSGGLD